VKRIAIIVCFIGKPHSYFGLFLKSVAANPSIDFILLGHLDGLERFELPSNFKVVERSLKELEKELGEKLHEPTLRISKPYKTGDFRPMFGEAYENDLLKDYDEWGYCDLDIIVGDLRGFLPEAKLEAYDKIYPLSHVSLYKNTPEINRRWRLPDSRYDYHEVISSPEVYAFEEWRGIYNIYMRRQFPFFRTVEYLAPSATYRPRYRFENRSNPRYERNPDNHRYQCFYWEDGHLYRAYLAREAGKTVVKNEEYVYMHFMQRTFPEPTPEVLASNSFFCAPQGFFKKTYEGVPRKEDVKRYNPMPFGGVLGEGCHLLMCRIARWTGRTWRKITKSKGPLAARDTQIAENRKW